MRWIGFVLALSLTLAPLVVEAQQAERSIGLAISATLAVRTIHSTSLSAKVYVSWATTRGATSSLNAEVHRGSPTEVVSPFVWKREVAHSSGW
jgi:hypothetical protein